MVDEFLDSLAQIARDTPTRLVRSIITIDRSPDEVATQLQQRGLSVTRQFKLVKAVAVEGEARIIWGLRHEKWVLKLEEDREVKGS